MIQFTWTSLALQVENMSEFLTFYFTNGWIINGIGVAFKRQGYANFRHLQGTYLGSVRSTYVVSAIQTFIDY